MKRKRYEWELARLEAELAKLQDWIIDQGLTPPPLRLPDRQAHGDYKRSDWSSLLIPEVYSDDWRA